MSFNFQSFNSHSTLEEDLLFSLPPRNINTEEACTKFHLQTNHSVDETIKWKQPSSLNQHNSLEITEFKSNVNFVFNKHVLKSIKE